MKIICEKAELLKGLQVIQTVVPTRSTLPVLSNFLLQTEQETIKLSCTDLEIGVSCYIKGEIVKGGEITIPAKKFTDIIRELPEDKDIEIKSDDNNQINIKCGKSNFNLMGLPKADYPLLPDFPSDNNFEVKKEEFKEMLKKVSYAVSNDETRYVLNGVFLIAEKGELKMVATDGRRLSYISKENIDKKIQKTVIIPSKCVNEIQRILSQEGMGEKLKVGVAQNQIAFKIGSITMSSLLIEGTFPNYEQVIPKKFDLQVKVKTKEALSAVRQISTIANDKTSSIRLSFGKGLLRFSSSQGNGSGEVEIDIDHTGQALDIAFNPVFVNDILKNIDEDEIVFELTGSLNPAVIRPVTDKNYICVIMPMKV